MKVGDKVWVPIGPNGESVIDGIIVELGWTCAYGPHDPDLLRIKLSTGATVLKTLADGVVPFE